MDAVANEPGLAQEIMQLLYKKLQQARQELDDLRTMKISEGILVDSSALRGENEGLREELASLHLQLSAALEDEGRGQDVTSAEEGEDPSLVSGSFLDRKQHEEEQKRAIEELADKAELYKRKYKKVGKDTSRLKQSLSGLQEQLQLETEQADAINGLAVGIEADLARGLESGSFDLQAFLESSPQTEYPTTHTIEPLLSPPSYSSQLPKSIRDKCVSRNVVILRSRQAIWHENLDRGFAMAPASCFDPTRRGGRGAWIGNEVKKRVGSGAAVEVLYQSGTKWYYYGTYKHAGTATVSTTELQEISSDQAAHFAREATVTDRDQVAPVVAKFVEELVIDGVLLVECVGLQRTGYDQAFTKSTHWNQK